MKEKKIGDEIKIKKAKPNQTIREHTDQLLEAAQTIRNLKYIDENSYKFLKVICEYHDYGKVNDQFQMRVNGKKKNFDEYMEIPHNILSMLFLDKDIFENINDYYVAMACIIYHHRVREKNLLLYLENKKELIEEFKSEFAETKYKKSLQRKDIKKILDSLKENKTILMKGLLHKCDYAASAGIVVEYKNDFLLKKLDGLGYDWRKLQKFCIENRNENLIIIAPTGMGKTEAGLLWIGNNKGFFVLPLKTAINAMYKRVCTDILKGESIEKRVALLHGDMKAYYLENLNDDININGYYEYSKQMSLPITISTMDQLFDFVFKGYAYEYKLAQFSYSKIVIDEIQTYDATLTAFLIYGIEKIYEMGGKVAIITATLPPFVESKVKKALKNEYVKQDFSSEGIDRHNIKVINNKINANDIIDKFRQLQKDGKSAKILVICNSVEVAQDIYEELKDYNVKLVHSKYIKKDRTKLENEIIKCGKTYSDEQNKIIDKRAEIWISTSMVEASLDIDFDYLFTELNNLFSLFQRMGRCNRKGVKDEYKNNQNCFIYTELRGKVKRYIKGTGLFEYSKKAIQNVEGVLSEKTKTDLINQYLSGDNLCDYVKKYNNVKRILTMNEGDDEKRKIRDIATKEIIPNIVYIQNKEEIDMLFRKTQNKNINALDRVKTIEKIREYCVNLCLYEVDGKNVIFNEIIGNGYEIPIVECEYSEEEGFIKNSSISKKVEENRIKNGGIFIE